MVNISPQKDPLPKISVVLPTYNQARYLREAIDSVLAQTLRPFEIIICDDHSTDGSWAVIREYTQRYPELVKSHRHERNTGIAHNLNSGIERARGDLITWHAGDDRFLPRKFELEWKALQTFSDAQIAYSNVYTIDADGNRTGIWYDGRGPAPPSGDVFVQVFSKRFFPNTRSIFRNELVYRSALDEVGYFDEDLELHEDWDLKIRLTARFPVVYSGEALVEYRVHHQGIHNSPSQRLFESIYAVYQKNLPLLASRSEQEAIQIKRGVESLLLSLLSSKPRHWETASGRAQFLRPVRGSGMIPGFLVNSLPKAGTNLLAKAVALFPEIHPASVHIGHSTLSQFRRPNDSRAPMVPVGVDWPQPVSLDAIRWVLQELKGGSYTTTHIPFSEELAALLAEMGIKMLLILRDPRDVVVSHANYVARAPTHFLFELYQALSESERIMKSIIGVEQTAPGGPKLLNIYERCQRVLPWTLQPFSYTTYFEKLVGSQGGGTRETQMEELKNIAQHLGIWLNPPDIERIAEQVFGGTHTFRKGIVGDWRNHFSADHKRAFKELAGQILIDLGYEQDYDW